MSKDPVSFAASREFEINYGDRRRKIREAAAAAIKELSLFRWRGGQEALDAEVERIAKEKLHPHGCDLLVQRLDDGTTRFLIEVQNTGRRYDLIRSFFHSDHGSIPQTKRNPSTDQSEAGDRHLLFSGTAIAENSWNKIARRR